MEIRKTAGEREIERQEIKIRRVTGSILISGYRIGRRGLRDGTGSAVNNVPAYKTGFDQAKDGLRSNNIRMQRKILSQTQRKQWNSYSQKKQNEILRQAERIAGRSEERRSHREFHAAESPVMKFDIEDNKEYDIRDRAKMEVSAAEKPKDAENCNDSAENTYAFNSKSRDRQALMSALALKRRDRKGEERGRKAYAKTVKVLITKEMNKQRMIREQQMNDEITQMEAENAVASGYASYAMIPVKAKVYQQAGKVIGSAMAALKKGAVSLLVKCLPFLLPVILIIAFFCFILTPSTSGGEYRGIAHVPPEVEFYRPYLEKYAALYPGMEKLVDLMLAMIMQEAGGEPWIGTMNGDIMQSSESAGYPGPGYLTGEASIAQGVKYLATEVFNRAGLLDDPYNLDKTKLALQGYNYGAGYIPWALSNYGGYTEANAAIFSDMMAARLGWSGYGDKLYVQHVLRYYEIRWVGMGNSVSTTEITNQETKNKLEELSASWPADLDEGRKNIIVKGCTLVGYTTYDMYGADTRAGVDLPRTLDCSSFTAWCFQKCGYTDVPYWSTTGTFLGASNFRQISASELKPGDIGLINWVGSGGSNHVGIFVGRDSSGSAMWLHCTSHANPGSSIVTGPRISYYSAFSIFFRYTGFH